MRDQYLQAMGITRWVKRELDPVSVDDVEEIEKPVAVESVAPEVAVIPEPTAPVITEPKEIELTVVQNEESHALDELDWPSLEKQVTSCVACDLHATRTNTVFGEGVQQADWLIVGDAPGTEEDIHGKPFLGQGGQLLTAMIEAMGLKRENVFITNSLKCRPPESRDPLESEIIACHVFLKQQIKLLKPKVILAVGRVAAHNLLGINEPMKAMRGHTVTYKDTGIPVIVTYHPAYLLRAPSNKGKAWQDLQLAMKVVAEVTE